MISSFFFFLFFFFTFSSKDIWPLENAPLSQFLNKCNIHPTSTPDVTEACSCVTTTSRSFSTQNTHVFILVLSDFNRMNKNTSGKLFESNTCCDEDLKLTVQKDTFKFKPELSVRLLPQIDYTCFVGLDVTPVLLECNFTLHHTTSFQTNVNFLSHLLFLMQLFDNHTETLPFRPFCPLQRVGDITRHHGVIKEKLTS